MSTYYVTFFVHFHLPKPHCQGFSKVEDQCCIKVKYTSCGAAFNLHGGIQHYRFHSTEMPLGYRIRYLGFKPLLQQSFPDTLIYGDKCLLNLHSSFQLPAWGDHLEGASQGFSHGFYFPV